MDQARHMAGTPGKRADRYRVHALPIGLSILILIALFFWRGAQGVALNLGYVALVKAGLESASFAGQAENMLTQAAETQSSARWGLALLAKWQDNQINHRDWLEQMLSSPAPRIRLLRALRPDDREMALATWQAHPDQALAAFWVAETMAGTDAEAAITAYESGLQLEPRDGLTWVRLGRLYQAHGQPKLALAAFGQGCLHWDQGKNGCMLAGRQAEELGLVDRAVDYYQRALVQLPAYRPALQRLEALTP